MIVEIIAMNRIIATIKNNGEIFYIDGSIKCKHLHSPTATKLTINNIIAISLSESSYINKKNFLYNPVTLKKFPYYVWSFRKVTCVYRY